MQTREVSTFVGDDPAIVGSPSGLTRRQRVAKRLFDVLFALVGLVLTGWLIAIVYLLSRYDTGESGFFRQARVGKDGESFEVIKIRTMRSDTGASTTVTTSSDPRITRIGSWLRTMKIDELPQLINVLRGEMSFVGPRPDVPGFADQLKGEDRIILTVRPGITGPATLAFRNEEKLLLEHEDPEAHNREVIYPAKVALNRAYIEEYSFWKDLKYLMLTVLVTLGWYTYRADHKVQVDVV